ncbi:response regulator [Clostridium tagluense]|uniref:response regulator n=1 Tax=Clostridium tagluense TaxID=360422 RepID=UPI0027148766|nr:response regulator [Clostridium tagluense]
MKIEIPDIILLDIMMPGMDGYEVCRCLKSDKSIKDIPIVFLTAMTDIANKTKVFELGAVDYMTKPFEVLEVKSRVLTHL